MEAILREILLWAPNEHSHQFEEMRKKVGIYLQNIVIQVWRRRNIYYTVLTRKF